MNVTRRNLSQAVATDILEAIRDGKYPAGQRLPTEQGLMEQYGVGRNSIREAIHALVAMGVLDVRPGRGTVVLGRGREQVLEAPVVSALLRDQSIEDLYDLRKLLEVEAAGRAAARVQDGVEHPDIDLALYRYRTAVTTAHSPYLADLEFHRAVALASGNVLFPRVLDGVAEFLEFSRSRTDQVPGAIERALADHGAIRDAIVAGDVALSRRCMTDHIAAGLEAVHEAMRLARQGDGSNGVGSRQGS